MRLLLSLALFILCWFSSDVKAQNCDNLEVATTADISSSGTPRNEIPGVIGNPLELNCDVTLDDMGKLPTTPAITSYVWTRNGEILPDFTGSSIEILNLESSDGGEYRCSANTDLPCTTVVSDVTTVTTAPSVTLDPLIDFSVNEGESFQITCNVQGWPVPTIEWTRSTSETTVGPISTNPTLFIDSPSVGESGDYTCVATNGGGDSSDTITVTVNELPTNPPTNPTTAPPTRSTTTDFEGGDGDSTSSSNTGDTGSNTGDTGSNTGEGIINTTETEVGFYIGIAVTAVVCLILTLIAILSIVIWYVRKRSSERKAQQQYEEEEEETL